MKVTFCLLIVLALFISAWSAQQSNTDESELVKHLVAKQNLKITWEDLMDVLIGIEYELNKGKVESFIECMIRDERTLNYIYDVVNYLRNSDDFFLKKAWTVLGKFFQDISVVIGKWIKQHITSTVKGILYKFLSPSGFFINKVFNIFWYSEDITNAIKQLMENTNNSNYFGIGTTIGKILKIAQKIFEPIYEGFTTKEHAFLDGYTQEFAPEISNQLELCVGLDNQLIYNQIEINIMKISNSSSKSEISEIIKNITNIYFQVANNQFCNFGDLPIFLNEANNRYAEWSQSKIINEGNQLSYELKLDYLLQAKKHFESMKFIDAGKLFGKITNIEMNIDLIELKRIE